MANGWLFGPENSIHSNYEEKIKTTVPMQFSLRPPADCFWSVTAIKVPVQNSKSQLHHVISGCCCCFGARIEITFLMKSKYYHISRGFFILFIYLFIFGNKVLPCSPLWLWTSDPSASASWVLELQAWTTRPGLPVYFLKYRNRLGYSSVVLLSTSSWGPFALPR
jgi:hypothetical protein